ncbi:hypothetical protein [Qipengyuania sp. MTN3-11]|uniref:hypothetical protein n=1 Tax=Qipengyuania sp. MTN3-11 TaxID=3056557 RepID=UPI0036F25009
MADAGWADAAALRDALTRADAQLSSAAPLLRHLLSARDQSLFSDSLVARIRGMLTNLAWQMLRIQAEATGEKAREQFAERHGEALAERFFASSDLVDLCHSLALEWQLAGELENRLGIDPVLSPLIQQSIGAEKAEVASTAMAVLAAQTRFVRQQERMELPLTELAGELFDETVRIWREFVQDDSSDALTRAESRLRSEFDEGSGRLALLARFIAALGSRHQEVLSVQSAGVAIFLSALAIRTGQGRVLTVRSTNEGQIVRLALSLRAAGLKAGEVDTQLLAIHPDLRRSADLDELGTREAADWLSSARKGS